MLSVEQPDHKMVISIKDKQIIGVEWGTLYNPKKTEIENYKKFKKYLKKSKKWMNMLIEHAEKEANGQ